MKIYIENDIRIKNDELPVKLFIWLKDKLTIENPKYKQAEKLGYSTYNIERYIQLYERKNGMFIIPRGLGNEIIQFLRTQNIKYELQDKRLLFPKVNFQSNIKLRDYQANAVERMLKGTQGFLKSPCGSGKTVMMIELMTRIQQPTLFIVHQKELMDQIVSTAVTLTDLTKEEIGIIGSGKRIVGDRMTVATVQTLNRMDLEDITDKFGAVFIDEAHHVAAQSFYEVISKFKGCYRFAVSATPERADGLSSIVYTCTGPIVHEIPQAAVPTIIPSLKEVRTSFESRKGEHQQIVAELIKNKERNQLIIDLLKEESPGNYSLVLSDRVEHLKTLEKMMKEEFPEKKIHILVGSMPKKERMEIMQQAKNKQIDILLATQLAREGLDIPHLNRLFLTFPKKSAASVEQEVGRIMRPADGKKDAVVFDFIDNKNGMLYSQYIKRRSVYKKIGMGGGKK